MGYEYKMRENSLPDVFNLIPFSEIIKCIKTINLDFIPDPKRKKTTTLGSSNTIRGVELTLLGQWSQEA